jgi:predicted HAD superfamily Cof-like phosphohydrolase
MDLNKDTVANLKDETDNEPVALTRNWFMATGQMPLEAKPDTRQIAFYMGMQCEELAEKLAAVFGGGSAITNDLAMMGSALKKGRLDQNVADAINSTETAKDLLDGDVDLLWVTVGAAQAAGADLFGAWGEVAEANWAKRFPDGTFHRDPATGKVLKPEGWAAPDLSMYVHPDLRG